MLNSMKRFPRWHRVKVHRTTGVSARYPTVLVEAPSRPIEVKPAEFDAPS